MLGFRNAAMAPVQAHNFHQIIRELPLLGNGIVSKYEAVIHGLRLLNLGDQRHNDAAQLGKESIQGFHIHTFLIFVQQRIVGQLIGIVITGKFPVKLNDLLQTRRKGCKIILVFCLFPDVLGIIQQHGIGNIFLRGDLEHLVAGLLHHFCFPKRLGIQLVLVFQQESKQFLILIRSCQLIDDLGQNLHGFATAFPAVGWGNRTGIVIQHTDGVVIGSLGLLQLLQFGNGLFYSFKMHSNSSFYF